MADDQSQRPARANESPARARAANPATDPLAELARLIGQTDPFSEFGRDSARRAAPVRQPAAAAIEYAPQTAPGAPQADTGDFYAAPAPMSGPKSAPLSAPEAQPYAMPNFSRQPYGSPPLSTGNDLYQVENDAAAYQAPDRGYSADEAYRENVGDRPDDVYDDVPPSRRRVGIIAIAGVFALAVIGTAGAFGYRAIFGSTGSSAPPPVIKADTAPSKIVPSNAAKDAQPNKQITDRVNDRGQGERLVSREETPVDIRDKTAGAIFPPVQNTSQPPLGSGIVGSDPKRVRTIAITPDQMGVATASAATADAPPAAAPARAANAQPVRPAPLPPPRVADVRPPSVPESEVPAARPAAQPRPPAQAQTPVAAPSNAPLSLNPNAAPPARPAAPTRTAAVAPTQLAPAAATGATGGFAVQVSSQRSEAEAQAAYRALQAKFPDQLGSREPLIRRVDLGEKGVYYRAMVGPFPNGADATGLCSNLKAAGGSCIVQKN